MSVTLAQAFPGSLKQSLESLGRLPETAYPPVGSITNSNSREWSPITVQGEPVVIPYRIYNPVPVNDVPQEGSLVDAAVDCIYTRHNDGFVRQSALRRMLAASHPWTVPFVLQLLGEYVIEICEDIQWFAETELAARAAWVQDVRSFAEENPDFIVLTRHRATSYWECYYRGTHHYRETYPGLHALDMLLGRSFD